MKDIFKPPLTQRGFLLHRAFSRAAVTYGDAWDPNLGVIFSIIYLYGGEFYGMFPGCSEKVNKAQQGVLGYTRSPWILFNFRLQPFFSRENQIDVFKTVLSREGFDSFAPYSYITETGTKIRKSIDTLLGKKEKTSQFKKWEKDQKKWKELIGEWHDMFYENYAKNFEFKIKFFDHDSYLALTIQDDVIENMKSLSQIKKRQLLHKELLIDFATFLCNSFLNKEKGFGKCLYE
jgi:hypothetical protein